MIFATAGHTDHGKTQLIESLTGVRTDRLPEEKLRGLTIDLGFAYLRNKLNQELGFVDVPGHERFSRNMLSGITGVKNVILVVAADDALMPQTIEHVAVLHLLEIELLTVVVTKIDLVDNNQIIKVTRAIKELLASTCLNGAPIKYISNNTGENIPELRDYLFSLDKKKETQAYEGSFRMAIDSQFSVPGVGLVVTGTVHSGKITLDDSIDIFPKSFICRIRGLRAQDKEVYQAYKGDRCAINLVGTQKKVCEIKRGMWIRTDNSMMRASQVVDVLLNPNPFIDSSLKNAMPVHFHHGTSDIPARLYFSNKNATMETEEKFAQIRLERSTLLYSGDYFILRNQSSSHTIAGGKIIDPFARKNSWHEPNRNSVLKAFMNKDKEEALNTVLELSPQGVFINNLMISWDLSVEDSNLLKDRVLMNCFNSPQGKLAFSQYNWSQLSNELVEKIQNWHESYPSLLGIEEKKLFTRLGCFFPRNTIACVISQMVLSKQIFRKGGLVYHKEHRVVLSEQEIGLWKRVSPLLNPEQKLPPKIPRIATKLDLSVEQVQVILKRACDTGEAIITNRGYYFTITNIIVYAKQAEDLANMAKGEGFSIVDFRKYAKIGRNLAYELLTYFELIGLTQRIENKHFMQGNTKNYFS